MDNQTTANITPEMEVDQGSGLEYIDYTAYGVVCPNGWVRDFQRRYEPPLFSLIVVLGTMGNLLVVLLYLALRNRMKTMTDVFLLNLAMADLLFLATLPFWAVNAAQGWAFGPHAAGLCNALLAVYKLNFISGMLLLTCISVDRYVAIVRATRAHNISRERRMIYGWVTCLAVWLLSTLLALPEMLFAQVGELSDELTTCEPLYGNETWIKVLVLSLQVCVGFVLPLVVMTACYSVILHTLLQARSFQKHKALRVILAVVVVFVLSQLPYNVHLMLQATQVGNSSNNGCDVVARNNVVGQVAKSLAYTHACINPFLYVFVGNRFRRDLLWMLKSCVGRLRAEGRGKIAPGAKRPSMMFDTETTGALSL